MFPIKSVFNSSTSYAQHYLVFDKIPNTHISDVMGEDQRDKRKYKMRHYDVTENEKHPLQLSELARH